MGFFIVVLRLHDMLFSLNKAFLLTHWTLQEYLAARWFVKRKEIPCRGNSSKMVMKFIHSSFYSTMSRWISRQRVCPELCTKWSSSKLYIFRKNCIFSSERCWLFRRNLPLGCFQRNKRRKWRRKTSKKYLSLIKCHKAIYPWSKSIIAWTETIRQIPG